jgi:autoinducer 2-degrading protein
MFVTLVHVHVKPDRVGDFIDLIRTNHEASVRETGNVRFDVLQSVDDPTRFLLHEWYVDEASAMAHRETPHYLAFREAAEDLQVEPRQGVRYRGLFPEIGDFPSASTD